MEDLDLDNKFYEFLLIYGFSRCTMSETFVHLPK